MNEIIIEFPSKLTEKEKKMIYGYKGELVRCKDCKHWGIHKRLNVPWCFEMHIDKSADGYCDSGERREDERTN